MRSLGIIGAFITFAVLVSLLDQLITRMPPEPDIILVSRFLIVTIGTSSVLLSTVQVPTAPVRVTRIALSSQRRVRRYTHEMFAAPLMQEINTIFLSHDRRNGTGTGVRRLFSRCTRIPAQDWSQRFKAPSIQAVCLRRGW